MGPDPRGVGLTPPLLFFCRYEWAWPSRGSAAPVGPDPRAVAAASLSCLCVDESGLGPHGAPLLPWGPTRPERCCPGHFSRHLADASWRGAACVLSSLSFLAVNGRVPLGFTTPTRALLPRPLSSPFRCETGVALLKPCCSPRGCPRAAALASLVPFSMRLDVSLSGLYCSHRGLR